MYPQNPYMNYMGAQAAMNPYQGIAAAQPTQVVKVNGENGARTYQLGANSSALLLDESGLMVWLITTDGAGYKTVSAYDITPHTVAQAPDFGSLENRIKRLEEIINGSSSDSSAVRGRTKDFAAAPADDQHDQISRKSAARPEPAFADKPADAAGDGDYTPVWRGRE